MEVTAAGTTAVTTTERILIATDGGTAGSAALRWVLNHLGDLPARLELICAAEDDTPSAKLSGMRARLREQERLLRIVLPRVDVASSVRFGHPAQVLERSADSRDLVVIGTHHGLLGRRRTRGFPQQLARSLPCPLVAVPSEWISGNGPIVLGVTNDTSSDSALLFAQAAARRTGRRLTLAHVWDMPGVGMVPAGVDVDVENIPERQRLALSRFSTLVGESVPDLDTDAVVRQGPLVATLTDLAQGASLLVVGRPVRSALAEAMLGSVGRGLLSNPPCPVAIVP